jgi:hypothetical protein
VAAKSAENSRLAFDRSCPQEDKPIANDINSGSTSIFDLTQLDSTVDNVAINSDDNGKFAFISLLL